MFSCYFLSVPITITYHHLSPAPITTSEYHPSRVRQGAEGELVPLLRLWLADDIVVIVHVVRWRGHARGQGYLCGLGTGRAGVSAMTRRANRGKRRGGMEREIRARLVVS